MNSQEIFTRLRIGLAVVIGFVTGKLLATTMGHHASEFFIGGFGLGVVATHGLYWVLDSFLDRDRSG